MTAAIEKWNRALSSGDDALIAAASDAAAVVEPPEWRFTRCDWLWREQGALTGDIMEASGTDVRNRCNSATTTLVGSSPHIGELMRCRDTLVGLKMETAGLKLAYWAKRHFYRYRNGELTSVVDWRGIWDILNYYTIFPTWQLPIQFQPISHAVYAGNIVTVIETMVAEAATRIQLGVWEATNNALSGNPDLRAWLATLKQSDGNVLHMLKRPVYVVRSNPFLDSSPSVVRLVRMETCGQVITDLTGPYGIDVSVDLWEPGDPQPDRWANLDLPTYVVRVRDRSQIEGPTKTVLDTAIRDVVDLVGSAFGNAVAPLIQQVPGMESSFIAPSLGVNYVEPWVIFEVPEPGEHGSVLEAEIVDHAHDGWRIIQFGKSPQWLNSLINSWLGWLMDAITIVIGIVGVPSDLLSGFMNDAFYAGQLIDNYDRRDAAGPYHPAVERVYATQSSGYTIIAALNFIKAFWETRPWTSAQITCRSGPGELVTLGKDLFKSSLASVVYFGRRKMLTDFVEQIMWRYSETERDVLFQVGDGRAEEPPIAKHERRFADTQRAINALTLAPRSG